MHCPHRSPSNSSASQKCEISDLHAHIDVLRKFPADVDFPFSVDADQQGFIEGSALEQLQMTAELKTQGIDILQESHRIIPYRYDAATGTHIHLS